MILYHFSNEKFSRLIPKYGERRYPGEDISSLNKKCIYLTTSNNMQNKTNGNSFYKYRYTVKIDDNDRALLSEENFNNLVDFFDSIFNTQWIGLRWFSYTEPLNYIELARWDPKINQFILES